MTISLDSMIANLHELGDGFGAAAAREAAPLVEAILKRTAAAGTTPSGKAWEPRKSDGGRAYKNAAERVSVKALGNIVKISLDGGEVYGQYGVRGMPVRNAIPIVGEELPPELAAACAEGARRAFDKIMSGGAR